MIEKNCGFEKLREKKEAGAQGQTRLSCSHQVPQVGQVNVAVFVHLHYLYLHARHLGAGRVGAVRRLGDETHLLVVERWRNQIYI